MNTGGMDTAASSYPADNYLQGWRHTIKSSINQECNWPETRWGENSLLLCAGYCCHLWWIQWGHARELGGCPGSLGAYKYCPEARHRFIVGSVKRSQAKTAATIFLRVRKLQSIAKKNMLRKGSSSTIKLHPASEVGF